MVKRLREIKQYGNSKAIKLEPADLIDMKLDLNDKVDISDLIKHNDSEETESDKHEYAEDQLSGICANKQRMGVRE